MAKGLQGYIVRKAAAKAEEHAMKKLKNLRKNPPVIVDTFKYIAPAAGAYVVTRVAGRLARSVISQKFPKAAPFATPIGSLAAFAALWYATHKVSSMKRYHDQAMIGAGLAVIQSLVTSFMPKLLFLFDAAPPVSAIEAPKSTGADDLDFELAESPAATSPQGPAAIVDEDDGGDDLGSLSGGWADSN